MKNLGHKQQCKVEEGDREAMIAAVKEIHSNIGLKHMPVIFAVLAVAEQTNLFLEKLK